MLMMKPMRIVCVCLVLAAGTVARGEGETRLSKPVPAFSLKNLDGLEVASTNYAGKTRLILFWASWDKPCQRQLPALVELQRDYRAAGVTVLGISLDKAD